MAAHYGWDGQQTQDFFESEVTQQSHRHFRYRTVAEMQAMIDSENRRIERFTNA